MIKKNFVGKDLANYNALLVLSHFKGHPMGGYGGALKQLSIGIASSYGKAYIHGVGDPAKLWTADHDSFLASMADAASSVIDYFKGNAVYINVMKNMSVDCDCCAVAEDPCMKDIGILASDDPVAIDQACADAVMASEPLPNTELTDSAAKMEHNHEHLEGEQAKDPFCITHPDTDWRACIAHAEKIGLGTSKYELIEVK